MSAPIPTLPPIQLAVRYALFALVATGANLAAQEGTIRLCSGALALPASVAAGTLAGLIVKYALDKRYIFRHTSASARQETGVAARYAVTGVLTTTIFWGFEAAFHILFDTKAMRYLGGAAGLLIGYRMKYGLDKRFVFQPARVRPTESAV